MSETEDLDLHDVDWSFGDADTDRYSATIHPYHARFIPQIPERLITRYTDEGDRVLDPFVGSGTTTMVGSVLGRPAVGVDLNPLACLVARVKCTRYDVDRLESHAADFLMQAETAVKEARRGERDVEVPEFPDSDGWYLPEVQRMMATLLELIEDVEDPEIRDFYRVCFSAVTKPVSRSREDWTYVGDNMLPASESNSLTPDDSVHDVNAEFERRVKRALDGVRRYTAEDPVEAEIYERDSRDLGFLEDDSVEFAVTSPPYANAVDYARYHRLSFYWLGYPVDDIKEDEVGARAKRGRQSAVDDYFRESREVYREVHRVLRDGGVFAVVVGNSQRRNEEIDTVGRLRETFDDLGFTLESEFTRELGRQSMSQKEIDEESILVLRK